MATNKPVFRDATYNYFSDFASGDHLDMQGGRVVNLGTPSSAGDAATKAYVDSVVYGLSWKNPVKLVATANIASLSGTPNIDSIATTAGDRVLLTAQSTASQNGIWVVAAGAWSRPADFPTGGDAENTAVWATQGTLYADTAWVCTTDAPAVIDTNNLAFIQFSSATGYTGGDGIILSGNEFSVELDTTPGLQFVGVSPNGKLAVKPDGTTGAIQVTAAGVAIKLNGTTLQIGASGISVKGLPSLFEINGVATSAAVTAANVNLLVDGTSTTPSYVGDIHDHKRVADTVSATADNLSIGDPIYYTTTANTAGKARADTDAKSFVMGLARAAVTSPAAVNYTSSGLIAIGGLTAGSNYYLAPTGGIQATPPGGGNRVVLVGVAKNTTDLMVKIHDFGKKP